MKPIVILSGPVGAGKTTIARALVAASPPPVVHIEGDQFWSFIAKDAKRGRGAKSFKTLMTSMTAAAIPFARADYEVILDFSIPPWFLDTTRAVAARAGEIALAYVVVRPSERVCAARAANRPAGAIADYAPYRELYADFDGWPAHTLADDDSDAATLAARIRERLDAGAFGLSSTAT
ncbi:MAG TPA: AAA family ATPase [Polyangia bacterium]|jgi:predicted kinase